MWTRQQLCHTGAPGKKKEESPERQKELTILFSNINVYVSNVRDNLYTYVNKTVIS